MDTCTEQAFLQIKELVKNTPVLRYPDAKKPFAIECDASDYAIGAVLMQLNSKNKLVPIEFMSKQLDNHQKNWHCCR